MCRSGCSALHGVNHNLKKGANLKTEATGKQSTSNFPKNEHFLPLDMHAYVCYQEVINVCFLENLICVIFFYPRFEIRVFALSPAYRTY